MDYAKPEDLYIVVLLHNIGKLVIAVYSKDEHGQIISLKKKKAFTPAKRLGFMTQRTVSRVKKVILSWRR